MTLSLTPTPTPTTDHESTTSDTPETLAEKVGDAVLRHNAGDERAMTDLVRCVTPWLLHICRGYRLSQATAEDVVQNTLLVLVQHVRTVREPRSALSWLSVVARREALRALNKDRRAEPVEDMAVFDGVREADDPQYLVEAKLVREALLSALARLPARRRNLIWLLFLAEVEGYARVGDILGMPVGSIGPTRQRGLDAMRALLDPGLAATRRRSA
jgi:RNA polymerase sigma factor (sigma-70 family)